MHTEACGRPIVTGTSRAQSDLHDTRCLSPRGFRILPSLAWSAVRRRKPPLPERNENGSVLWSDAGKPWLTPPDARGRRIPFYIHRASISDMDGGTVAREIGPGSEYIAGTFDSTDTYRALYLGLFGRHLPPQPIR